MGRRRRWVLAAAGVVLLWRVVAFRVPSSLVDIPDGLHLPLALLGVLFLVCGVAAWWARPGRWTAVFLLYGLGGGVHWGGAIGAPRPGLELGLFFVYLSLTALGDAALLHLALIYPKGGKLARGGCIALYSPAALALLVAVLAGRVPQTVLEPLAGILLLVANLFSLGAGLLLISHLFTVDHAIRRAARLPLVVAGVVSASVVALLGAGGVLPGEPEAWNLVLGLIPLCLALALVSQSTAPARAT